MLNREFLFVKVLNFVIFVFFGYMFILILSLFFKGGWIIRYGCYFFLLYFK